MEALQSLPAQVKYVLMSEKKGKTFLPQAAKKDLQSKSGKESTETYLLELTPYL